MPVLLLLMGAATLALVASNSTTKTPKSARSPYNLDANLDPRLRVQVEAALNSESDPTHLDAFASALQGRYPYAVWYLQSKAAGLRRMGYGAPPALPGGAAPAGQGSPFATFPVGRDGLDANLPEAQRAFVVGLLTSSSDPVQLDAIASQLVGYPLTASALRVRAALLRNAASQTATSAQRSDGLDVNLPDSLRFNVVELLTAGNDPAQLDAFATQLTGYPMAQAMLRMRAATLRAAKPAAPAAAVAPPPVQSPPFQIPGLDPGMPPEVAMQIAQVLMTENDPAKLREYGNAVSAVYPAAATMLLGKANAISPPATPRPPAPVPAPTDLPVSYAPAPAAPPVSIAWPAPASPSAAPLPPQATLPPQAPVMMPPPAAPQLPGLFDAGMTPDDQARIVAALSTETDPDKLRMLADAIAPHYPKAALLLSNKAEAISTLMLASKPPVLPATYAQAPAPAQALPAMGPPPTMFARSYKVQDGDFPIKIAKKYGQPEHAWPELVAANPTKARAADGNFKTLLPGETLAIPASWPASPGAATASHAPAPAASPPTPVAAAPMPPAPAGASVPAGAAALDPGMPGTVAQAVLTALATEGDAATLRNFASSIMATYPIAAGVLLAKANTLGVLINLPGAPANNTTFPAVLHIPSSTPTTGAQTYKVIAGDSPSRIAKKLIGNDARWPELVAANPQKPKAANGNFKNLQPGDVLQIPASWLSVANVAQTKGAPATARA